MTTEAQVNHILRTYFIKASCKKVFKTKDLLLISFSLKEDGRINDLVKFKNEISLMLGEKNEPTISKNEKDKTILFSYLSENRTVIKFEKIYPQKPEYMKFYLGQSYTGQDISFFMHECPHILLGGTTGSGKTVLIKTMLKNIERLGRVGKDYYTIIVDPKRYEFLNSKNHDVVFTYQEAIESIDYLLSIMEERFKSLKTAHHPYMFKPCFLIIDELSDLLMQDVSSKLKTKLCLLAQKCRSADIFIIAGTQRPSASIVSGNIKANFPARISCKTASHIDSKIILDESGAEKLLGKGDAILKINGRKERFQVAI